MLAEKGYLDSEVTHEIKPMAGQAKTVHVTFNIVDGPKYKIREIDFAGNKAIGDGTLKRRMKETKELWPFSFITGRGVYKDTKYEEDAEKVQAYYRDRGYITTQVGNPEVRTIETTKDGSTRFIKLVIPVSEGPRYKIGKFDFAENKVVKAEALRSALQGQGRAVLRREEHPQGPRKGARSLRLRRLLGVHRLSDVQAAGRARSDGVRRGAGRRARRSPPSST